MLGAAVIIGAAALIAQRSRRRSAIAASWRSKVVDAYGKGSTLYDMMSMAEVPEARSAEDTRARWTDIRRYADGLAQTLYALRASAPGEAERARVTDVLASLQAVWSAMEAERAPGGAGAQQTVRVHDLLMSFRSSLRALRSPGESVP